MCLSFFSIYRRKPTFMKLEWNTLYVASIYIIYSTCIYVYIYIYIYYSIYIVLVLAVYPAPHTGTYVVCIYVVDQRVLCPVMNHGSLLPIWKSSY